MADFVPVKTSYNSLPVDVPDSFLTTAPPDAKPVTITPIDWSQTVLPENDGRYAVLLDNVLSPSECAELQRLAESSVRPIDRGSDGNPWQPALVNYADGFEVLVTDYRNSDRIIWDRQDIADRLWERCLQAPGLREKLTVIKDDDMILGMRNLWDEGDERRWEFRRVNQRLRFLKYTPGQFFRPHNDGPYRETRDDNRHFETLFTVHLYLNNSKAKAEEGEDADLVGGATSFLSSDETRKVDVNPKAGQVLIFQHRRLYHSGDDVIKGTKYTMRTDIMYECMRPANRR
ncbi:hypothetical protein GQ53DRAFT_108014 [Thozetella sp. PMI_491]|nr:hypothetical protein GQ53DRAFT_108014 [Thozetella sp. PMI_491]